MCAFFLVPALLFLLCLPPTYAQDVRLTARDALHLLLTDPHAASLRARLVVAARELERQKTLAAADGIPLMPAQLQSPSPPPGEDAAPLYDNLSRVERHRPLRTPVWLPLSARYAYTPGQLSAVRLVVRGRPDITRLVQLAAARPQCIFVRDWSQVMTFPEYACMKDAVRVLCTEGFLLTADGHAGQTIDREAMGFRIARHAQTDPSVIGYITGEACRTMTLNALGDVLQEAGRQPGIADKVRDAVFDDRIGPPDSERYPLAHALAGEAGRFVIRLEQARAELEKHSQTFMLDGHIASDASGTPLTPEETTCYHNMIVLREAQYLEQMRRTVKAAKLNDEDRCPAFDALSREIWPPPDPYTDMPPPLPKDPMIRAMNAAFNPLLPSDSWFRLAERETIVMQHAEVVAAAATILDRWMKEGHLPQGLDDVYTDFFRPADNQTLAYRREGKNGFVISSIGPPEFDLNKKGIAHPHPIEFRYPVRPVPVPTNAIPFPAL